MKKNKSRRIMEQGDIYTVKANNVSTAFAAVSHDLDKYQLEEKLQCR